jgi:hypothetical protein
MRSEYEGLKTRVAQVHCFVMATDSQYHDVTKLGRSIIRKRGCGMLRSDFANLKFIWIFESR